MNLKNLLSLLKDLPYSNKWSFLKKPAHLKIKDTFFLQDSLSSDLEDSFKKLTNFNQSYYFSSARMGLYWFLKQSNIGNGDIVALQSFNCAVVPDAIIKTGADTKYLDITYSSFSPSERSVKEVLKNIKVKAIIFQNSFGFFDYFDVAAYKKLRPDVLFILDSSLSFSLNKQIWQCYDNFDSIILSCDLSKPLALMTGGILLAKNKNMLEKYKELNYLENQPSGYFINQLRLYILLGNHDGINKFVLSLTSFLHKKIFPNYFSGFQEGITSPKDFPKKYSYPSKMPLKIKSILNKVFYSWDKIENVRLIFRDFVIRDLENEGLIDLLPHKYYSDKEKWVPLRIPLVLPIQRNDEFWKKNYSFDQWWFKKPIINSFDLNKLGYDNDCKNAEAIGENILNFPVPSKFSELKLYKEGFNTFLRRIKEHDACK